MKNKFLKIVSSLLVLSFLAAAFSVFSFAENTEDEAPTVSETYFDVFYNRNYEEGWDWGNGFDFTSNGKYTYTGDNKISIDYEEDLLGNYNYFARFEVASDKAAQAMMRFAGSTVVDETRNDVGGTVIEFSIKADDVAQLGNVLNMATAKGVSVNLLDINGNGELIAFSEKVGGNKNLGKLGNEWVNLVYVFDWTTVDNLTCTIKVIRGVEETVETHKVSIPYEASKDVGMSTLAFRIPALASRANTKSSESKGMSYCIDNLKVYHGTTGQLEVDADDKGKFVDTIAEKVIEIKQGANVKTKDKLLEEALALKVGVDFALARNVRYSLVNNSESESYSGAYGAPVRNGDDVLVPLQLILDYIGFPSYIHPDNISFDITTGQSTTYITIGSDTARVGDKQIDLNVAPGYIENSAGEKYLVASMSDIATLFPGWLTIYDDMGLILVYEDMTPEDTSDNEPIVNRKDNLDTMVNIMKKFVFDTVVSDNATDGYVANGEKVYKDVEENTGFAHPYIIADADMFKKVADKYALAEGSEGYDKAFTSYVQAIIDEADAAYLRYAKLNGTVYSGVQRAPVKPNTTDGYDNHGEMTELLKFVKVLPTLAFAYQMTGNSDYAKLAYDISAEAAKWTHWGPGYAIHFAEITSAYAISYDWLYNEYKELGLDTEVLAKALFELGVHDGYISSSGKTCEHGRGLGDLSVYNTATGSTNAIGTSGMIIGALAILDYVGSDKAPDEAYAETVYLIGNNIQSLVTYGLDIYAPDGSYIESPMHWESATSAFFRMAMAFESAAGTDYGFMDTWAMDKTCYYAVQIESSDGYIWNYNESTDGASLNTDMFYFVGAYYGDENLLAVRDKQLNQGKKATMYDLLFYPFDGITKAPELALDYTLETLEAFVTRSDWNKGAIYTGLMGGMNNVPGGQLDSGNFIYHNKGITWVMDLGTENPYIEGINDAATRYKFYRNSAEGQNVLINTDDAKLPYGQNVAGGGYIEKTFVNEHGSYAILENTDAHALNGQTWPVSTAKRGVLLTNDRSTVVLQDEFAFVKLGSLAWVLHTKALVTLDSSGRVAYFTATGNDGQKYTLRASIVSSRPDFKFKLESATRNLLTATSTGSSGSERENPRNNISKLVIEASTVISFELAVVFEIVENSQDTSPVTYSWTRMSEWEPSKFVLDEAELPANIRGAAEREKVVTLVEDAKTYLSRKSAFTEKLSELYRTLTDAKYIINEYPTGLVGDQVTAKIDYQRYSKEYAEFINFVNEKGESASNIATSLVGLEVEADEADESEEE